jgi:hypothetical protein
MCKRFFMIAFLGAFSLSMSQGWAQAPVPINYDNLSFQEEPLAFDAGNFTLDARILLDQAAIYDIENENDIYNTRANFLTRIESRLSNSMRVSAQYFGQYDRLKHANDNRRYSDNVAFSLSDQWGTASVGNVTGAVRENTRRRRGVGNADLHFDDFYGGLDESGGFYAVRNNAYLLSLTADAEGRAEAGMSFNRPVGQSFYSGSFRFRKGDLQERNFLTGDGETYGAAAVLSYAYSNWLIDSQFGYEYLEDTFGGDTNRYFGSIGAQIKLHLLSLSAEGHIGSIEDEEIYSTALGLRYDLARGASLNFGYNYADNNRRDIHEVISSIRYEF